MLKKLLTLRSVLFRVSSLAFVAFEILISILVFSEFCIAVKPGAEQDLADALGSLYLL